MQINVIEYLECGAARLCPSKTAIVEQERSFTFAELERYAKRCATLLIERTEATGEAIAVFLPKCAEVVFADLGIVYTGNAYMNLDVKSPGQRIAGILGHIRPVLVVTSDALASQLIALGVDAAQLFRIEEIYGAAEVDEPALRRRRDRVIDTAPLCIINTSGSTGIPKGVALNHRSTIDFMDWCFDTLGLDGSERIGSLSPFYFDIYTLELNLCIAKGATLVLVPDRMAAFPARLLEFVSKQAVSFVFWVPSIMVSASSQDLLRSFDLTSLRKVFFAGEVFPMKHLNRWRGALPQAMFVNLYGPIEITVDCTYFIVDREFGDDEQLPIGFPCRNTGILILNDENRLCAPGEKGELCVRGSSLAIGYWNDPEKTARAFVQNPLETRYPERIYRTGDLAYLNERGEILFAGRKDFQVKHMGYRIELPEIEYQTLLVEGVANACVLYNEGRKEITVFYEGGESVTPAAIRRELGGVFPKYMLPTAFHRRQELPRNPNGKIDRNGLSLELARMT